MLSAMKAIAPLLALFCLVSVFAQETKSVPPVAANGKLLVLDPLNIRGKPVNSFGFDLLIYADPQTKKVSHIVISRVIPGTDAEKARLRAGDEIIKVDGVEVRGLDPEVSADSALGRIFLNRPLGTQVKLEALIHRTAGFTLHVRPQTPMPD